MIDFSEVYDRFEGIKRTLIGLENRMRYDNPIAAGMLTKTDLTTQYQ